MCLLTFVPQGVQPDFNELCHGIQADPDGSGFVIATNSGNLIIEKAAPPVSALGKWQADLTPMYDLAERFVKLRARHPEMPAMFHSRYGTSGLYGTYNVHPFMVGSDKRTVMAHNGVISSLSYTNTSESDTHIFAKKVMPQRFPVLDSKRTQRRLAAFLGRFNKIAVITMNPAYKANAYLINAGAGVFTKEGVWHSNSDYLQPVVRTGVIQAGKAWWDDPEYGSADATEGGAKAAAEKYSPDCELCGAYLTVSQETNVCSICLTCQDCHGIQGDDCDCWIPERDLVTLEDDGFDDDGDWEATKGMTWEQYLAHRETVGKAAVAASASGIPGQPARLAIEA